MHVKFVLAEFDVEGDVGNNDDGSGGCDVMLVLPPFILLLMYD